MSYVPNEWSVVKSVKKRLVSIQNGVDRRVKDPRINSSKVPDDKNFFAFSFSRI